MKRWNSPYDIRLLDFVLVHKVGKELEANLFPYPKYNLNNNQFYPHISLQLHYFVVLESTAFLTKKYES